MACRCCWRTILPWMPCAVTRCRRWCSPSPTCPMRRSGSFTLPIPARATRSKVYDYPMMQTAGGKQATGTLTLRSCCSASPLSSPMRKPVLSTGTKVILITGGGGSIGSELCRQLAKMEPKQIVILDIYENRAYDIQQELKIAYGSKLDLQLEICSVTHRKSLGRCSRPIIPRLSSTPPPISMCLSWRKTALRRFTITYSAQKPWWNCARSTPWAVYDGLHGQGGEPHNVMGATKRMCEMIVGSAGVWGTACYSATRFGNVLGSAGSVIPLFKRQIASGGPHYPHRPADYPLFHDHPRGLPAGAGIGAMAKNGELFVLDMGQPVKILDLAQSMIRLSESAALNCETGLRPGRSSTRSCW